MEGIGKICFLRKQFISLRFYRLNPQRELGNLFSLRECSSLQAGIGNIEFVKDLATQSVLVNNFKCSKFGPHTNHKLGWVYINKKFVIPQ